MDNASNEYLHPGYDDYIIESTSPVDEESLELGQYDEKGIQQLRDVEKGHKRPMSWLPGQQQSRPQSFAQQKDGSRPASWASNRLNRAVTASDWSGPNDPENPFNWPMWKRVYHTAMPALLAFAVTFGSSVYTPATREIAIRFKVSETAAICGLSLYVLGLGFGPMLAAPISETKGRKVVYIGSIPPAMLFTLGVGYSKNFGSLLVCRFFAGFFASPVLAVGGGSNVDVWPPQYRAYATASFLLAPFLGPALGPAAAGYAVMNKGWKWSQWVLLFALLPLYIGSLFMSETYKKIILMKRAKRLDIPGPPPGPKGIAAIKVLMTITLFRPIKMLMFEPIVTFLALYVGFNFSVLFAFFDAFPIVFMGQYGFNLGESGLSFLGIAIGCITSVLCAFILDRKLYRKEWLKLNSNGRQGNVAPEHRLYIAMIGSFTIPIGLFWFAWTARREVHWISPIIATIPFAWGNLAVFLAAAMYSVDVYGPLNGASALAANGLVRYISGAAFPLFTVQMYDRLHIDWATSLLGFLSILMIPIPWVLFKWGPQIRRMSKMDTVKA